MLRINLSSTVDVKDVYKSFKRATCALLLLFATLTLNIFAGSYFGETCKQSLWNPFGLLFGPMLYFSVKLLTDKTQFSFLKHFSAFVVLGILHVIVSLTTDLHRNFEGNNVGLYHILYLTIPLSMWYYSFKTLKLLYGLDRPKYIIKVELVTLISIINIFLGVLYSVIFYFTCILNFDMVIDYRTFTYSLLLSGCFLISRYFFLAKPLTESKSFEDKQPASYANALLSAELTQAYKQIIIDCFEMSDIYLRPDLSVTELSEHLGIPKHHLSQLFSTCFNKNFYSFVAEYRISYAIKKMSLGSEALTIESRAYECGFNSKTSFNRYFKEITGLTPHEYRVQHLAQS